ncbi:MAG: ABC transporter ATP-binding protein [Spirochaetales bacterium]
MLKTFASLLPYLKRYGWWYFAGLLCLLVTNAGQIQFPQWLKQAVNQIASGHPDTEAVAGLMVGMAVTALLIALGRIGWRVFLIGAARRIEKELREDLVNHLMSLPASWFANQRTGDLLARATNDMEAVRMSIGMVLVALTDAVTISGAVLVFLLVQDPVLGLIIVSPLPVITVLIVVFGGRVGVLFKKVQEEYSALSTFVQETLAGSRVIKAFVQEATMDAKFRAANQAYLNANMELVKLWGFFFPIITALSGLSALFLLYWGGQDVMSGKLSPGDFTAYLSYLGMLIWPLMGAGMVVNWLQRGAASLARIREVIDTQPAIVAEGDLPRPETFDLEVRGLSFAYGEGPEVLHGLNLTVGQGQFVGLLGRVGSGKTTLTALLPRTFDPPPGTVFLGGQDIRNYRLNDLRSCFSVVPQSTFLFSDTIRNNIAFARPETPDARLREMAELSTISRDIDTLSHGWDTEVGERGVTLSGGQKQRLSLSRALNVDAPILILDDALSAVDLETEEKIITHLRETRAGKTNLLISHRVATLRHCDLIVVLDDGRVVDQGTHAELMARDGFYAETARLQHVENR